MQLLRWWCTIVVSVVATVATAEPKSYVRSVRNDAGVVTQFQTAIASFVSPDGGQTVDLVGAVHIGDHDYYAQLNERFRAYDAVLFELVAPTEALTKSARDRAAMRGSRSGLSAVQLMMTKMLDVTFQLDEIDYAAANFVHADMSPEELTAEMARRGESFLGMVVRLMLAGASLPKEKQETLEAEQLKMLLSMLSPHRAAVMKRSLAVQFDEMDYLLSSVVESGGSSIVIGRNDRALAVLRRQLPAGAKKKIAIFYGAAHLPDLAKKLKTQFGLRDAGITWLTAWNIPLAGDDTRE